MAQIPPLSSADELRIRNALEKVADSTTDGEDPNDVIVKVAADAGLPPGHVDLLVRGYNIARTTWQRESGADVLEKAAEFPLADPDKVRQRLFKDHVKEAGVRLPKHSDYFGAPDWLRAREQRLEQEKRAQFELPPLTDRKAPPLPEDPQILAKRAYQAAEARLKALEGERLELADVQTKLYATFTKIAESLEPLGAPTLTDLRPDVQVLYGKVGEAVLDQVARMRPGLVKKATGEIRPVDQRKEPYASIQRAVMLSDRFVQKLAAYQKSEAACDAAVARHLAPYFRETSESKEASLLDDLEDDKSIDINGLSAKEAGIGSFGNQVGLGVAISSVRDHLSNLGDAYRDAANKDRTVNRTLARISSPDHEDQLREIQTRAMLQDLLTNDPVISGYDPHEVASAFNELSQLAPRTAAQPVLARALLRKSLQLGALDSFEGNEAVSTEHKLRDLQPNYSTPKPGLPNAAPARSA